MEYTLQDNRFFAFLCPLAGTYGEAPNRIELLLDIYTGNVGRRATDEDRRRSYKHIEQRLRERPDDVWPELVDLFHTLESWYRNPFCYNLIGFLAEVYSPKKVVELYAAARQAAGLRAFQLEVLRQVCLFVAAGKDDAGRTVPAKDRVAEAIETLTYKDEKDEKHPPAVQHPANDVHPPAPRPQPLAGRQRHPPRRILPLQRPLPLRTVQGRAQRLGQGARACHRQREPHQRRRVGGMDD